MTVRKKILTILEAGHYAKDRIDNNLLVFYNPTQDYVVSDTGGCFLEKNFNAYEKSDIEIYLKNNYVYNIGDKVKVLTNYHLDDSDNKTKMGDIITISGFGEGFIWYKYNSDGEEATIDIRCIAPVLD